ncbi:hypothetical protein HS041_28105 [Planomonospora sp. ID67723]|uniref:hypothetical protein n=1 Tax=Planomonospora sp. ID67723 TaxID=2738134 RepID=UPI0018C40C38|nr:hypothetical protein [Planomonospora sp. ID67723]MBG0831600.1 hypothetical protein [Planomonospora sp. ID67723]
MLISGFADFVGLLGRLGMYAHAAVAEAELAASGLVPVTIVHGEDLTELDLVYTELPGLAARCGAVHAIQHAGDYTTVLFSGVDAERTRLAFMAELAAVAPPRWRITADRTPDTG